MLIQGKEINDFKTERKNIAPALPMTLRMVPILFYLSIVLGILLNGLFVLQLAQATRAKDQATQELKATKENLAKIQADRTALEAEVKRASDVATWVESSRPLQPLVVDISRSIEPDSSIVELKFERDPENPTQIKLGMRLNSDSTKQLDAILEQVAAQQFRIYTPQQTVSRGEIEYKATLVWQAGTGPNVEAISKP